MQDAARVEVDRIDHIQGYQKRICEEILPFWAEAGFDRDGGVFRERLDFSGQDCPTVPRRAMVQARQIYVYSAADKDGVFRNGADLADRAMHSFLRLYLDDNDPRAGFAFSIDATGNRVSQVRDSYTHAFALFSLASLYQLTGEKRLLSAAELTLQFVDRHLVCKDHGGLLDRQPSPETVKRQNPLMHFLEACLALHEAAPDGPYLERAESVVRLFESRLLQWGIGALPEIFAADWSFDPAVAAYFEPGHHFEWIWLLDRFRRLGGRAGAPAEERLWELALACGLDARGRCYDSVGLDRRPLERSTRLWPHTEGAKAGVARFAAGEAQGLSFCEQMLQSLNELFLAGPFAGGWIDRFDANLEPSVDHVPASSLYHLYGAFREVHRFRARQAPQAVL
ncbi:AGE family epimerase/isomerase [Methylocystis bryophila]|uniref:AGE family epimerase/isomerase n=1 Tax=Methylocystis bryophila TaxID=655015 RepID=UPI000A26E119|nr:AGE family epimerase/isomerase [Methylocystis bryophila]BDV37710.1 mannose-6-phosphate isomerase [Methylocystis bryophila]